MLGLALLGLAVPQSPAVARPFLYMSSFDYTGPYATCLANAEKALRAEGFSRDLKSNSSAEEKAGMVYAFYNGEAIIAEIQCIQKAGITLLGVAGIDNESTWKLYQNLRKADW